MMNVNLRQGYNSAIIVGKLKNNGLTKEIDNQGKEVIKGSIIVESDIGNNQINETYIRFYTREGSKPFENIKEASTLPDAKSAIDESFIPKVRVVASFDLNEYANKRQGKVISDNQCQGIYIYETDQNTKDSAILELDTAITEMNDDSGQLKIEGYAVGYRNKIIELKNGIVVPDSFAEDVKKLYKVGDTARLTVAIHNKVTLEDTVTFGYVPGETRVVTEQERFLELMGGREAYAEGDKNRYTQEEIEQIKELRGTQYDKITSQIAPSMGNDFGGQSGGFGFHPTDNDDIPF